MPMFTSGSPPKCWMRRWAGRRAGPQASGRLQPREFRLELEAQLGAFLVRQAVRHLREDGAVEGDPRRLPWHRMRRSRLGENPVEFLANLVGVGVIFRRFE